MGKRKLLIMGIMAALLAAAVCAASYLPRPVLREPDNVAELSVRIYIGGKGEEIEGYDEQAVLEFLTSLRKQRTAPRAYQYGELAVRIDFFGSEGDVVMLFDDAEQSCCADYYRILDAGKAFAEICAILNIDA